MNPVAILGIFTALIVGLFVAIQAIFAARASLADHAISTGLMIYMTGGLIAAALLLPLMLSGSMPIAPINGPRLMLLVIGGLSGVVIVTGSAYAFAKISPAAAVAMIVFGQMLLAVLADIFGWTGQAPLPLDLRRIAGLAVLAVAIWLLLPRND
ncbi:DMT family transporter [uncultured Cohaesibacter sp.]|uniref:DMT family transporter n=1 Tax=uncultured Cohaesibacter sp. TaxID=1002546 RepID=UPI0029C8845F|nr:DMT family transporter [uncultured Cohaesibacter sp.]